MFYDTRAPAPDYMAHFKEASLYQRIEKLELALAYGGQVKSRLKAAYICPLLAPHNTPGQTMVSRTWSHPTKRICICLDESMYYICSPDKKARICIFPVDPLRTKKQAQPQGCCASTAY
jgi:hypothetical protein